MSDALRVLDVSRLEPPEPLAQAVAAIDTLTPGTCLCLLHRREPLLLYPMLDQLGFEHITCATPSADNGVPAFHIYIWRRQDARAEAVACQALSLLS